MQLLVIFDACFEGSRVQHLYSTNFFNFQLTLPIQSPIVNCNIPYHYSIEICSNSSKISGCRFSIFLLNTIYILMLLESRQQIILHERFLKSRFNSLSLCLGSCQKIQTLCIFSLQATRTMLQKCSLHLSIHSSFNAFRMSNQILLRC